jgi:LSD1 subclass zinc finger protein
LALYGLNAQYDPVRAQPTNIHQCGACGSQLHTLTGARQVACETCGHTLDIVAGAVPCRKCGAQLSFPVAASQIVCPYCQTETRRV